MSAGGGGALPSCLLDESTSATIDIDDATTPPVVNFDPANANVVAEGNTLTLNIVTSGSSGACDVSVFTTNGSAQSPADFTSFSQTISINGSASVNLTTIIDALPEGSELLTVELAAPDLATLTACTLGTNISSAITIQDAGTHTVEFTASSFNASEGSSALAEVTASALGGQACDITITTSNGSAIASADYTAQTQTLVFSSSPVNQTLSIPLATDTAFEGSEYFNVTLSAGGGGALPSCLLDESTSATIDIADATTPPVVNFDPINASIVVEGNSLTLDLVTSGSSGACDVTVFTTDGSAQSPADFTSFSQTIPINGSTSVTLTTNVDTLDEESENLTVSLGTPDGITPNGVCTIGLNNTATILVYLPVPDTAEPNDTESTATPLTIGAPQSHNLMPAGDIDFYSFSLIQSTEVVIETFNDGTNSDHNTVIELFVLNEGSGEYDFIAINDDIDASTGIRYSRLQSILAAANYYVRVTEKQSEIIPSYGISVKKSCDVDSAALQREVNANGFVLLSLPCDPPRELSSINDVLQDNVPGIYGTDWIMWLYDENGAPDGTGAYVDAFTQDLDADVLRAGDGFWFLHLNSDDNASVTLDLPTGSTEAPIELPLATSSPCMNADGCFVSSLSGSGDPDTVKWQLLGNPYHSAINTIDVRLVADTPGMNCLAPLGCNLTTAGLSPSEQVTLQFVAPWDETLGDSGDYVQVGPGLPTTTLDTWAGAWVGGWEHGEGAKFYWPKP